MQELPAGIVCTALDCDIHGDGLKVSKRFPVYRVEFDIGLDEITPCYIQLPHDFCAPAEN